MIEDAAFVHKSSILLSIFVQRAFFALIAVYRLHQQQIRSITRNWLFMQACLKALPVGLEQHGAPELYSELAFQLLGLCKKKN
jgi:hypothetical protein